MCVNVSVDSASSVTAQFVRYGFIAFFYELLTPKFVNKVIDLPVTNKLSN